MKNNDKKLSLASLAKKSFIKYLKKCGYEVSSESSKPYADIEASQNGETYYYEIKATSLTKSDYDDIHKKKDNYFGSISLTEMNLAINKPERYKFVLVFMDKDNPSVMLGHQEYSVDEMLRNSTIPPFRLNINIPYSSRGSHERIRRKNGTVVAFDVSAKDKYLIIKQLSDYYVETLHGDLPFPS